MSQTDPTCPSDRPRNFEMLRSLRPPDFLTLGNAACGTLAIFMCLNYLDTARTIYLWVAFLAFPFALALDVLDGYMARRFHNGSPWGMDLDSLSDVISFGVAPAVVGYTLGLRGGWDVMVLIYFVSCGIGRLARYNVTYADMARETGKVKYYQGTPIPTSVLLVGILAVAFQLGHTQELLWLGQVRLLGATWHPLAVIYLISGSAMISAKLRIPKL